MLPKYLLAYLPELIGLSGLTLGVTELYSHTIINNSGTAQPLNNVSGELYSLQLGQDLQGTYNTDLYHNGNYIAQGIVKISSGSGYYVIDDPFDISSISKYPIEIGNSQFNQEFASKSQIDSIQIKINQILDELS